MKDAPSRIGIRDVASKAGLSVATVSRTLNGVGFVKQETRERVMRAVAELNYIPDPHARSLTTRRSKTIAAVVTQLTHPVFSSFLATLERSLADRGYALVVASSDFELEAEVQQVRRMLSLGVDGLILSGEDHASELFELVRRQDVPVVTISTFNPNARLPTIGYDNVGLGETAAQYLHDIGHRRIAGLHGPAHDNDRTQGRIAGLKKFAGKLELAFVEAEWSEHGGANATREIMATWPVQPTALLCLSDVLALGAMFELQRSGKVIPDDYSVMGFDGLEWADISAPPLTTIRLPVRRMAKAVSSALVDFLEDGQPITAHLLDGGLVERGSTKPVSTP